VASRLLKILLMYTHCAIFTYSFTLFSHSVVGDHFTLTIRVGMLQITVTTGDVNTFQSSISTAISTHAIFPSNRYLLTTNCIPPPVMLETCFHADFYLITSCLVQCHISINKLETYSAS